MVGAGRPPPLHGMDRRTGGLPLCPRPILGAPGTWLAQGWELAPSQPPTLCGAFSPEARLCLHFRSGHEQQASGHQAQGQQGPVLAPTPVIAPTTGRCLPPGNHPGQDTASPHPPTCLICDMEDCCGLTRLGGGRARTKAECMGPYVEGVLGPEHRPHSSRARSTTASCEPHSGSQPPRCEEG